MIKRCCGLALATTLFVSCAATPETEGPAIATTLPADVIFTDVTADAGVAFTHHNGRSGKKYLPETLGPGLAWIDYDSDGWPDLFLVNSRPWAEEAAAPTARLYRNNRQGGFEDVTERAGLAAAMYGMGAAFGDVDNDGDDDLYVTGLDGDRLFRNRGDGTFADATAGSGVDYQSFGTSAAFLDYDRDGLLDLFVDNYVEWSPEKDLWCTLDGETKTYCTPESYQGVSSKLYRNLGDGRFEDTTRQAGVYDPTSKALGVAVFDLDSDGWPDIFQANDTEPNKLYRNNGDGTFTDIGLTAGVAFAEDGRARGAMGVDAADYDGSGKEGLIVGNFSNEMINLFHNEGSGLFVDDAPQSEIGRESLLALTFGAFFFDYDLDGRLDAFFANGHLDEEIENVQPKVTYAQPPLLFHNGDSGFTLANYELGPDFNQPLVARGAAYADYDGDGDLDIAVTTNNGPAKLLRNDGGNANNHLRVRLVGAQSNHDGFGAKISVQSPIGRQSRTLRSGSSYLSQSEAVVTFGLGSDLQVDVLEIEWPSGATQTLRDIQVNRSITIEEKPRPHSS